MADRQSNDAKPWTIKGMPVAARKAALEASKRERLSVAAWMAKIIQSQVSDHQSASAYAGSKPTSTIVPGPSLDDIERIVNMTAQLAAAGAPPPKEVVDATYQSLQAALARVNRAFQG